MITKQCSVVITCHQGSTMQQFPSAMASPGGSFKHWGATPWQQLLGWLFSVSPSGRSLQKMAQVQATPGYVGCPASFWLRTSRLWLIWLLIYSCLGE